MAMRENLLKLLEQGQDTALLRFTLGGDYLKTGENEAAVEQLRQAVQLDPKYSAAWKLLGRVLTETGDNQAAIEAYEQGIATAQAQGDKQAEREMQVFLKRLQKTQDGVE